MIKMYHVSYHTRDEAEDMSGFVAARTPHEAAALWFQWFRTFAIEDASDSDRQCCVNEIPSSDVPHAFDWSEIMCVGNYLLCELASTP